MDTPTTAEIALEVDRLVIGVHRAVISLHRSQLGDMVAEIGVASPGHFYDLAEFLAGGVCTAEIARRRFRYEAGDVAAELVTDLRNRRLLGDELQPCGGLTEVVDTIFQWRAETAEDLWGTSLATANSGASDALAYMSGTLVDAFRSLPEPTPPEHRLHHLLTGLRYGRMEAHFETWEQGGLTATEIVALSAATKSESVSTVPGSLVARGWLTAQGTATAEGHAARSAIEVETNRRCEASYCAITDQSDWLDTLRSLPSHW